MEPSLTTTKIDWKAVVEKVNQITGKSYSAQYLRDVARNERTNKQLAPVLRDLGVMKQEAA